MDEVEGLLAKNLLGFYLHGSLAMNCFNPARSDLDFLVVTHQPMLLDIKKRLTSLLLKASRAPHPIEISFLPHSYLIPWQYPTPFDFHYSETWRYTLQQQLGDGAWTRWNDAVQTDPDLAAHITIIEQRGICLSGAPIRKVFPVVPAADYLASILSDVRSALDGRLEDPLDSILNLCRICAFNEAGLVCSKQEGGQWALTFLPVGVQPVIHQALETYATGSGHGEFDPLELAYIISAMRSRLSS
ncbi:MAG TPA: aminoglycoside adenylyltransferase domain-containing protein [Anaerolineales bacterium]